MIAQRGRPSGVRSIASMSMGAPAIQLAKLGAASRPLSLSAKAIRSLGGKNVSRSSTPSLRNGGCCTWASSVARSRSRPAVQAVVMMVASRMCSRDDNGSALTPSIPSRLET